MAKARKRQVRGKGSTYFCEKRKLWVASVSDGFKPDGVTRNRVVAYGKTVKSALDALERKLEALGRGRAAGTVSDVIDLWLARSADKDAPRTHEDRQGAIAHAREEFGRVRAADLKPTDIARWHAGMKGRLSRSARWHAARALHGALSYAVEMGMLEKHPGEKVGVPPLTPRKMLTLTAGQSAGLMAASEGYVFSPLLAVALGSGCRMGELLGLGWDDIDPAGGTLAVRRALTWTRAAGFALKEPKTAAGRRTIALPPFAVEALAAHRERRAAAGALAWTVFSTGKGTHHHRTKVSAALKRAIKRANAGGAGIPDAFNFHSLRHTHASLLISQGMSVVAVSKRLGHRKVSITLDVYGHLIPGDDAKLAAGFQAALFP